MVRPALPAAMLVTDLHIGVETENVPQNARIKRVHESLCVRAKPWRSCIGKIVGISTASTN